MKKTKLKVGMRIRTNGDGSSVLEKGNEIKGIICYINDDSFFVANKTHSGMECMSNPYKKTHEFTWQINLNNNKCYIILEKINTKSLNKIARTI